MDELEKYKQGLEARINQYLRREKATEDLIAFEVFASAFSAAEAGYGHSDICDAYPISFWRDETVTIPKAIARRIFEGWVRYQDTDSSITLGNAFNLEGGQGKSPIKKINKTLDLHLRRSNGVVLEKLYAEQTGAVFNLDATYFEVAAKESIRTGKKVKPDTIKKAYLEYGSKTEQKFRDKHREVSDLGS